MSDLKPNLFIVGFQKCGSSSLFDLLINHPEISGSLPKETFALSNENYYNFNRELNVLNPSFEWNSFFPYVSSEKYLLEASVCNFYQDTALDYISKLESKKVIFIVRDPIQRFLSTYQYYNSKGKYLDMNLSGDQYLETVLSKKVTFEPIGQSLEHGKYVQFISKWKERLGDENVYTVGLNRLVNSANEEMLKLFQFLDLDKIKIEALPHKNKTAVVKYPIINKFLVKHLKGSLVSNTVFSKWYKSFNKRAPSKLSINEPNKAFLLDFYQSEYSELGELF